MSLFLIVIYCVTAAVFIFGLSFHDELTNDRSRKHEIGHSLTVIKPREEPRTLKLRKIA
jgi:hypothetical protein